MDIQITGSILLAAVLQGIALAGAYHGLKADNAALSAKLEIAILSERSGRREEHANLKETVLHLVAAADAAIKELSHRVGTLESGQDEWTQSLRKRTHELADQLNVVAMKVDRLERPVSGK